MKKIVMVSVLFFLAVPVLGAQRRGRAGNIRKPRLTLAMANKILLKYIDRLTVNNTLFTCRACFDFDDKRENSNFPIVSSYTLGDRSLSQYLVRVGYVRVVTENGETKEVFTAKAKKSKLFEFDVADDGRLGGAGLRFAHFKNPRILTSSITDLKNVPIEYDFVPEGFVAQFFGPANRVRANVLFRYEEGKWDICIDCK